MDGIHLEKSVVQIINLKLTIESNDLTWESVDRDSRGQDKCNNCHTYGT